MKRSWKILIALGAALAIVILIATVHHYQLRRATEAYIAQLKAQGEPMDLAQVLPPSLPPEQNSADIFRQAAVLMETNDQWWGTNGGVGGMGMVAPGKAMVSWPQPNIRVGHFTNSWQTIGAALDQSKESFPLLHEIINKPDFDFQINYDAGIADLTYSNLMFHLIRGKRASQQLSAAAIYDLHNSDAASAVENIRASLAVVQALRHDRLAISELVRIAMAQITLTANWELLQATNLTDQQLAHLQTSWANLDFIQSAENALTMERADGLISTAKWRNSDADLERYALFSIATGMDPDTLWDKAKNKWNIFMWRYWWSYPDELRSLKGYQVFIDTMRTAQTNGSFQDVLGNQTRKLEVLGMTNLDDEFDGFGIDANLHSMLSEGVMSLSGFAKPVMSAEVARRTVITAIALKRYQLKHGNYPSELNALVPEFVASVPSDPVDGKPLRYRQNSNGTFVLYSIGINGVDDGGNPAWKENLEGAHFYWLSRRALDWVWPQPATAEEIQNYYAHPPK
jgi:hypothetical protein